MKINEVIERHGMQLRDVSREMGMKPSALQSAIDRNLTVKTLRQISEAARIPIAEFFMDELTDADRQQLLTALQGPTPDPSLDSEGSGSAASTKGGGLYASKIFYDEHRRDDAEDWLSGTATPPEKAVSKQAIICPHCGKAMVISVASEKVKSEE